ncbi:alpha/beta hydrolase [Kribbella sp. NPDC048915]|uniref:alpha/beta hydrolase n=1 Tax=Kribbella sp. NPDC048915 TaxID=3155148 RepID=UPI0033F80A2B
MTRGSTTAAAPVQAAPAPKSRRIGTVVAGSLAAGLVAALLLAFLPVGTVDVDFSTAMVLFGFALGWALLAVLSVRLTDQPQRWAVVPAIVMAVFAALVLWAPESVVDALRWVWPPVVLALVVWAWIRSKRELHSHTRTWLLCPVLLVLALLAVGGGYETVSRAIAPKVVMNGALVDVGPYRLHLECHGTGSPTVILEPGAGGSAASMGLIAPAVVRDSRVCVYDRAGRGWSDPAADPPDGGQVATDLHTLLINAQEKGPYVLAGHSFGGLYVRSFAARYPDEVAGLVLVDSTAARSGAVPARGSDRFLKHASSLLATTSRLGVSRFLASLSYGELPPAYRDDARTTAATGKELRGTIAEYGVASRSAADAGNLRSLDGKPLVVLTAEVGNSNGWMDDQVKSLSLSTNSVHRVVSGATHASLVDDPDHAAAVTQAINDVIATVRSGVPLPHP